VPRDATQPGSDTDLTQRVVESLLGRMPAPVADAVRLGAIPHWFDQDLLARLGGGELDMSQVTRYLRRLRFVREDAGGRFRYHDEVRDYLLDWWRKERAHQYQMANRAALVRFNALTEAASDFERSSYEREVAYHMLVVDEEVGLRYLSQRIEEALGHYQLGLAEGFVAQAAELNEVLSERGRAWVAYFEARLDLAYHRDDEGEAAFQKLADHAPDPVLQAVARWSLGQVRVHQHRWSQAIQLYRVCLNDLRRERTPEYTAKVLRALGDGYWDLAQTLGGFQEEAELPSGTARRFVHMLQYLPFLLYRWLVRRVSFLPNWYFGTNYQNWVIAYLLLRATGWYRRTERLLREIGEAQALAEVRLSLAELEHQLGRWSRARRRYEVLLETDEIKGSRYRTARGRLGQGRALLDEGDLSQSEAALAEALETFRRFRDPRSLGATAALLGQIYTSQDRLDEAATAYLESARAFEAAGNRLAHTQVVWTLEELAQWAPLGAEGRGQIQALVSQVSERHYLTRFPDDLLRWFRRLALLGALPLTYLLAFLGVTLTLALVIVEGELLLERAGANVATTFTEALSLLVFAASPLFVLWLYRLIYSLMGSALVRFLGRRLVPIERDQPSHLITDALGLKRRDGGSDVSQTVAWADVSWLASIDYHQWRQPIHLISGTLLAADSGTRVMVDAVTAGYEHLKQDVLRHLGQHQDEIKQHRLDFFLLNSRWTLATGVLSLALALYFFYTGVFKVTYAIEDTGGEVLLPLSSIITLFVLTLLLLLPPVILWRLVGHQGAIRRTLQCQVRIIPIWLLWLAAILATLIALLLIGFSVLPSPQ
jgi:hypothetical protein